MADSYTTYGNFLLLKQRSKDGLGTLWRAGEMERNGFKRIVWLRRFDQPGLDRSALAADGNVATQLAQVLKATNVVRNATFGSEGGTPFMAWDYVPAQPLDQLLARAAQEQFPIAIDNALLIAEKLSAALAAALAVEVQGEPLTHGFLIPQLVVVGNDGEAMVAGFGTARGLRANVDRAAVQQMAAPYLAPEVLARGPASRRTDVYSLGAILYHLLTGAQLPADPAARAAVLVSPQLAFEEGPVPQDVLAILKKALEPKPEDRHASAVEFKRDLEKLLYGGAYSPTTFNLALFMDRLYRGEIEEEDRELQREKSLDVAQYYQVPKSAAAEPAATPPPPQKRTMLYAMVGGAVVLLAVIAYLLVSRPSGSSAIDKAAQEKMFKELVSQQVDEQMKKLATELEAERAHTAQLRSELDKQKQAVASGAKKLSPEEQKRQEDLQKKLAAQEAEQKRKEEEFTKARQAAEAQRQRPQPTAEPKVVAAVQSTAPPALPTANAAAAAVSPAPAGAPAAPTAAPPTATPVQASPTNPPTEQAPIAAGLGTGVREGDLVDWGQLDVRPEVLIEAPVNVPRAANLTRVKMSGLVILKALVNEKGRVDDAQVLRGFQPPKPAVDEACVESVKRYTFKPGMKNGLRVKTWMTITQQIALPPAR